MQPRISFMSNKESSVTATVDEVEAGVTLCRENARRLLRNARILIDDGGSDGLAYVLWSLAVEEFGKSVLLQQQVTGLASGQQVSVRDKWHHEAKFDAGFDAIPELRLTKLARVLRVRDNTRPEGLSIEDPLRPGVAVAVPALGKSVFSDGLDASGAMDATLQLRFDLLYVDWSAQHKRWVRPGETVRRDGLEARWELDQSDLLKALDALAMYVQDVTT